MTERKNDFSVCRSETGRIIARVAREHLSHDALLELRTVLCATPEWLRLTQAHMHKLYGMTDGAVQAWHVCGAIVWCHEYLGHVYTAEEFSRTGLPYSVLDISKSSHRWAADRSKRF